MKAIVAKSHRGAKHRYSATDNDGNRVFVPVDTNAADYEKNFDNAVLALCAKMDWNGTLQKGYLRDGERVYVWLNEKEQFTSF
jgi:hypothetical protein